MVQNAFLSATFDKIKILEVDNAKLESDVPHMENFSRDLIGIQSDLLKKSWILLGGPTRT